MQVVTGGAGFVAATLIDRLLARGNCVLALDNLSRGRREYWDRFQENSNFHGVAVDCADLEAFQRAVSSASSGSEINAVWHLAANSDIPAGVADATVDLRDTFMTTFNTLAIIKEFAIPTLHFASSSAIYGDLGDAEIAEDSGPIAPISNYGAMKLASEAQIRASVESFLGKANVFRFPNVVGVPATHGVILDFVRKLSATPENLDVLGDGSQRKIYLHVEELVEAMLFIADRADGAYNVYNIGPSDAGVTVRAIAEAVTDQISPGATISYGEGSRGWVGDVPKFRYSIQRLSELGWRARYSSEDAIRAAVRQIVEQEA